ncbi:MAG: hypothetical protein HRU15_02055 [Planctomycetes bacterium]|nr:hypothetical protein [Planctomycetota bacterium]
MVRLIIILAIAVLIALVLWFSRKGRNSAAGNIQKLQALHGTVRLEAITALLQRCAKSGKQDLLVDIWPQLELMLHEVLLDATIDHKKHLAEVLDACNAVCRNRDIARALLAVRNAMI